MTGLGRRGCDGCGRKLPVEDLAAVTLPGDERAVCCPDCREYAESVDAQSTPSDDSFGANGGTRMRGDCSGCGETRDVEDLEAVELPDGSTVACCPDCRAHADSISRRTRVDGHRGECAGCGETFDVSEMEALDLDGETTVACCGECAEYARAAARTTDDGDAFGDGDADAVNGESVAAEGVEGEDVKSRDGDAGAGNEENALAASPAICDQCGDWVDVELFEVVTAAERVEEFCPPCKDRARRNGVVVEVRMRRGEAVNVLGVDSDEDADEIRDAYLSRVKAVHPDTAAGSLEAFRRVQRAYERLSD